MKNSLIKLFAGVSIFASLFVVNVQALGIEDGNNSASESVTVGSVQNPVYSVDITWGDFSYDWVYDNATGEFGWKKTEVESCVLASSYMVNENMYVSALNRGQVYSDSSCSTRSDWVDYEDVQTTPVYLKASVSNNPTISITDSSIAGQVVPSVKWTPSAGYDWVTGIFNYSECNTVCKLVDSETMFASSELIYTDSACSTSSYVDKSTISYQANTYYTWQSDCSVESFSGGVIPDGAIDGLGVNYRHYNLNFELGIDSSKEIKTPTENDTIGTITVSISAKE